MKIINNYNYVVCLCMCVPCFFVCFVILQLLHQNTLILINITLCKGKPPRIQSRSYNKGKAPKLQGKTLHHSMLSGRGGRVGVT